MAYIPVPETLQANVRFTLDGQQVENVFDFSYAGSDFATAASSIAGRLNLTWWAALRDFLSDQLVHTETYMVDLDSSSGPVATFGAFTNPAGDAPVNPAPNSVALCITLRTEKRGRSFRGRKYQMGIGANAITKSEVSSGVGDGILDAYEALRVACATDTTPMVVASRYANKAPRLTGIATEVDLCVLRDYVVDSQRRRLPGRGT